MTTTETYKGYTLLRNDTLDWWSITPPSTNPNLLGYWTTIEILKTRIRLTHV